ncbi:unnamed protein product [Echinostoma caproni]|uniref:Flavodoxin-like domain-containing protein n=1 Tax=Echinostoma caproni TaxID=27848 RepID=A0A183B0U0_9TREM|nr:unnamed protein product [Echinostoma caproni]
MSEQHHQPHLVILYGSQTGTAQKLAERLATQARHLFPSAGGDSSFTSHASDPPDETRKPSVTIRLQSMDSYLPLSQLAKETGIVLFVCSTTGYGAPPDTMRQFWQRIMHRGLPPGRALPSTLRFAVLGLGDSSYPKFNVVAKKLRQRLVQLGASPLSITVPDLSGPSKQSATAEGLGLADEQAELGLYDLLSRWVPRFWTMLSKLWHVDIDLPPGVSLTWSYLAGPEFLRSTWPRFNVQLSVENREEQVVNAAQVGDNTDQNLIRQQAWSDWSHDHAVAYSASNHVINWFRIVTNKRVTAEDHFQDTRLVKIVPQVSKSCPPAKQGYISSPSRIFEMQSPHKNTKYIHRFFTLINHEIH